jgi:DNA-directed RNA polymerase subunit RPC12/RpoP
MDNLVTDNLHEKCLKKKPTTLNSSQNVLQLRMKCQEKSPKSVIIYILIENTTRTPRCGYRILVKIDVQLKLHLLYLYVLRIYLISRFWQCLQVQVYLNKVQNKLLCCNTDTIQKPTYILYRQIPASIY